MELTILLVAWIVCGILTTCLMLYQSYKEKMNITISWALFIFLLFFLGIGGFISVGIIFIVEHHKEILDKEIIKWK